MGGPFGQGRAEATEHAYGRIADISYSAILPHIFDLRINFLSNVMLENGHYLRTRLSWRRSMLVSSSRTAYALGIHICMLSMTCLYMYTVHFVRVALFPLLNASTLVPKAVYVFLPWNIPIKEVC